jgi:hypothetical protein
MGVLTCSINETTCAGSNRVERGAQFIIAFWHQLVLDLQLADYSRVGVDGKEVRAPENPGPAYASRALAIAHLAMYDAYVGVTRDDETYLKYKRAYLPVGIPGALLHFFRLCHSDATLKGVTTNESDSSLFVCYQAYGEVALEKRHVEQHQIYGAYFVECSCLVSSPNIQGEVVRMKFLHA